MFYKDNSKIFEMGAMEFVINGIMKESMDYSPVDPIPSYFYDIYEIDSVFVE